MKTSKGTLRWNVLCYIASRGIYSTRRETLVLVDALDANAPDDNALDAQHEQDNHLSLVFS